MGRPKIPTTQETKIDDYSKASTEPRAFSLPKITDWIQRWINLSMDQHAGILARCRSRTYHSEHMFEWDQAVDYQRKTGDKTQTLEFFQKEIISIEHALKSGGYKDFTPFNEFVETELHKQVIEQRYHSDEGHCAHDSLYNTVRVGFNRAVILVRDGKGPRYLYAFMAEEDHDTDSVYNPAIEWQKPLNKKICGRGLYHEGLADTTNLAKPGSHWHALLQDAMDPNYTVGIAPGFGDSDERLARSPRAVILVQRHGDELDVKILKEIEEHATYVAERIMPHHHDYSLILKS